MNKTYRMEELSKELELPTHTIYNMIRYSFPDHLKPKKKWNDLFGKEIYVYTDKDKSLLCRIMELKEQGLTYFEIKEVLINLEMNFSVEQEGKLDPMVENFKEIDRALNELEETLDDSIEISYKFLTDRIEVFTKLIAFNLGISIMTVIFIIVILTKLS